MPAAGANRRRIATGAAPVIHRRAQPLRRQRVGRCTTRWKTRRRREARERAPRCARFFPDRNVSTTHPKRGIMPHNDRLTRAAYATEHLEPRRLLAIQIDPSFGDAVLGLADTGVDGFHGTVMVRELSDGKVLTVTGVGFSEGAGGTNVNAAVARFTADGMPDASFGGGDGVALIPFGDVLADAVLHTDGTVVIVGNRAGRQIGRAACREREHSRR